MFTRSSVSRSRACSMYLLSCCHVVMLHVVMLSCCVFHVVLPPRSSACSMHPKASLLDSAHTSLPPLTRVQALYCRTWTAAAFAGGRGYRVATLPEKTPAAA